MKALIETREKITMPTLSFLAVQAIGLVPSIVCITSLQSSSRKRILQIQIGCCILWAIHYSLLGAYTAALIDGIGLLRAVLCACNDRPWCQHRAWPVFLMALYFSSAFLTWDGWYCLLPSLCMCLTTAALWTHNMRLTRLLFLLNSPPFLLYNLLAGSYSCAIIECFALASFAIAVYRFDIRKQPVPCLSSDQQKIA